MASPSKSVKSSSRWNFIQQAVASVESKLDTILGDEEESSKKATAEVQESRNKPAQRCMSFDYGLVTLTDRI